MAATGNCNPVVLTPELVCENLRCGVNLTQQEALRYIGILLCDIAGVSGDGEVIPPEDEVAVSTSYSGMSQESLRGINGLPVSSADFATAAISVTGAPSAGAKIVVTDIIITSDIDVKIQFIEQFSLTVFETLNIKAGTSQQFTPLGKFKLVTGDAQLLAKASAAGFISITVYYYFEA
jgi:hypothetical protein